MEFTVYDPDNDKLEFTFSILLENDEIEEGYRPKAGVNFYENFFWFAPIDRDRPGRVFYLEANDGRGGSTEVRFDIAVLTSVAEQRYTSVSHVAPRSGVKFRVGSP